MLLHWSTDGTRADPACGGHWCGEPWGSPACGPYRAPLTRGSTAAYARLHRARLRAMRAGESECCSGIAGASRGAWRPARWCRRAPVPRSPAGASTPPTNDRRWMGRPVHSPSARSSVRFVVRRDAAHRGLSGRRPRTFERTSIPTAVGRGRSRTRVTNRATMSDRPRAGTRPAGLIARRYQKDDRLPGQREAIVVL